jgi:poly(3-hydroxybutyrate) depolymerase
MGLIQMMKTNRVLFLGLVAGFWSPLSVQAEIWNFDFGATGTPTSGANNITNPGVHTRTSLVNSSGQATGVALSITIPFNRSGANTLGTQTPSSSVEFPASATRDSFFGNAAASWNGYLVTNSRIELTGLDPNYAYDFVVFASRMSVSDNRDTEYKFSGANVSTAYLNASNNTTLSPAVPGIRPTSSGVIAIDIKPGPANTEVHRAFYIGAMKMTSRSLDPPPSPIPSPVPSPIPSPVPSPIPSPVPSPIPSGTPIDASYGLSNGSNSIELRATLNQSGTVYYAVFNSNPGTLSASSVKSYSQQAVGGSLVARGSFARSGSGSLNTSIAGLPDKAMYAVYAVAANAQGSLDSDADVKRYIGVIPRKVSYQLYNSSVTNKSGGTGDIVRHYVYFPPGYYDNPSTLYPMIVYHGGAGENFTSSGNSESYFLSGHYRISKTPLVARINLGQEMPFVVVTPQCNNSLWTCTGATKYLAEVIDQGVGRYRVNAKQVHIMGMSNGGILAWATAYDYPSKVASIVPVAAKYSKSTTASNVCARFATQKVRVWAHHNVGDTIFAYTIDRNVVNTLKACAGAVDSRFTLYDGTTYPATTASNGHTTIEYVANAPWVDYSKNPAVLHSTLVPLAPEFVNDLDTAEGQLGASLNSIYDWMLLWSKP